MRVSQLDPPPLYPLDLGLGGVVGPVMLRAIILVRLGSRALGARKGLRQSAHRRAVRLLQHLQRTGRFRAGPSPWNGRRAPGTIVISTSQRGLYYVLGNGRALRYGVGVGRRGFSWSGTKTVSMKREWPDWRPPAEMLKRRPDPPALHARRDREPSRRRGRSISDRASIAFTGSNEPDTIGAAVSSGCIRMTNRDVIDLYERVRIGTKVIVLS